jgi:hypothetical protein
VNSPLGTLTRKGLFTDPDKEGFTNHRSIATDLGFSHELSLTFTAGSYVTGPLGGSDVSQTETTASPMDNMDAAEQLGFKWFSDVTDGGQALILARTGDLLWYASEPTAIKALNLSVHSSFVSSASARPSHLSVRSPQPLNC